MEVNRIDAKINSTGEVFNLYNNGKFQNFERIHAIFGEDYDDVNDNLLDGPAVNGWEYTERVYHFAEEVESVTFTYSV
jgi:hypothetical protein|nr:MAG TPA: hypothetical protein [Caudoviricetes sp.]